MFNNVLAEQTFDVAIMLYRSKYSLDKELLIVYVEILVVPVVVSRLNGL